jgi:RNA polymerase-binding transcription factor DksA
VTAIDTSEFQARLEEERGRLLNAVSFLRTEGSGSLEEELGELGGIGTDNHLGDIATATFDRGLDQGLSEGAQQTLVEIEAALSRIEDGTYGTCSLCGNPIGSERLRALPWARLCIDDQRRSG